MGAWGKCREPRLGVMLHYDGSVSDRGAVEWLTKDPRCNVSYQDIVLDDGKLVSIAPLTARAFHAGVCSPSSTRLRYVDANSAFYGLAIAAKPGDRVTPAQLATVVSRVRFYFDREDWDFDDTWRIVSHRSEAVFPVGHRKAGQRGRKSDPEPVMETEEVRRLVAL